MRKTTKEIINKSVTELMKEAGQIRQDIAKKKVEKKVKPDKNTNSIRTLKKRLAVVLTVARQKELTESIKK